MFTRDVLLDEKAPAFAILGMVLRQFGMDSLQWEPELLRDEINTNYDIKLSDLQSNKLQAAMTLITTDQFENDWRVFEVTCHLFNNQNVDAEDFCPLEAEEIAIGVAEALLIKKDTFDEEEKKLVYSDEIRAYAGHVFYEYGLHKAPKIFPNAIMPKSNDADDTPKNEALKEIFDAHALYILEYIERTN